MKSFLLLTLLSLSALGSARCDMNGSGMEQEEKNVRPAILAGTWYKETEPALRKQIDGFLKKAGTIPLDGTVRALISPHAGVVYSGPTAAAGYATVRGAGYTRVIVLAPSHRTPLRKCSIPEVTHYETPLGEIPLDGEACGALLAKKQFQNVPNAHRREHSLEIQLPFVQRVLEEGFTLIPILVGTISKKECAKVAEALLPHWDEKTLVVASSDFTHYGRDFGYLPFDEKVEENLSKLDHGAIERIEAIDAEGFHDYVEKTGATICGRAPIRVLLTMAKARGYAAKELAYTTSGATTGDWAHTVSYAAVAVLDAEPAATVQNALSDEEKATLLRLARATLRHHLETGERLSDLSGFDLTDRLKEDMGAFVTLKIKGRLRGCIGYLTPRGPLFEAVIGNTINAAAHDPRFPAVEAAEEPTIHIEISALSPVIRLKDPEEIVVGRDGLIISRGSSRGTLLPQVATEYGWDRFKFLEQTCRKAGLPADAWKKKDTVIERYEAQFFGEEEE